MNPAGFPLRAGRTVIFRLSPGLRESLSTPARVSTAMDAVVSTHSVVVPSEFGTARSRFECGFLKFSFVSWPSRTISVLRSYTLATA